MAHLDDKYPLLAEGYDILECIECEKECYPDAKRLDGSIVYNRHFCKHSPMAIGLTRSFEIDVDGEYIS